MRVIVEASDHEVNFSAKATGHCEHFRVYFDRHFDKAVRDGRHSNATRFARSRDRARWLHRRSAPAQIQR